MYISLHLKKKVLHSCQILMTLEFSLQISEIYSNFMDICPVEAESSHADGQT